MNYFYVTLLLFVFCLWLEAVRPHCLLTLQEDVVENMVVMDLGAIGSWYEPSHDSKRIVLVLYDKEKLSTLRILDKKIFPDHHVLLIHAPPDKDIDILCDAYECMLRYEKWERIVLIGIGQGALMTSVLYCLCQKHHLRLPSLLLHIDGIACHTIAWHTRLLNKILYGKSTMELNNVSDNYHNLQTPLLLFHSRNNKTCPFMDSILLFRNMVKIRGCRHCIMIPLYGNEKAVLLSKENQRLIQKALTKWE